MWQRAELKERGKICFQKNYWSAVAVVVILLIAGGDLFNVNFDFSSVKEFVNYREAAEYHMPARVLNIWNSFGFNGFLRNTLALGIAGIVGLMIGLLGILFTVFVVNILEVGVKRFFMENRERRADVSAIFYGFGSGAYGNVAVALFLRDLYIALWSLLLVIPGIIKSYEYRMVPYILSENPGMPPARAFEISRRMMDGQKMNTWILDLSFIGWNILAGVTCGIVGIFYVKPYYQATCAELYAVMRAHAFYKGDLTSADLPGYGYADYIRR